MIIKFKLYNYKKKYCLMERKLRIHAFLKTDILNIRFSLEKFVSLDITIKIKGFMNLFRIILKDGIKIKHQKCIKLMDQGLCKLKE